MKRRKRVYKYGLPPEPTRGEYEGVEGAALLDLWFGKRKRVISDWMAEIFAADWTYEYFKHDARPKLYTNEQARRAAGWKKSGRKP